MHDLAPAVAVVLIPDVSCSALTFSETSIVLMEILDEIDIWTSYSL